MSYFKQENQYPCIYDSQNLGILAQFMYKYDQHLGYFTGSVL